ncbi:MAG: hypothetical protein IJH76_05350 [Clostridia bacterium]|nr:hypothetical protein [Clostridia bacterium]
MQYFNNSNCKNGRIGLEKFLINIFKEKVKNITYLGRCELHKMPEYKFRLFKYNVVLEDFSNYTIFIKIIDDEKIEETLFCYWFFCEEYYGIKNKQYISKASIINLAKQSYETKYNMEILNKKNIVWKTSFVDIINLKEFYEKNTMKNKNKEKETFDGQSLFISVI